MSLVFTDVKTAPSAEYTVLKSVSLVAPAGKVTGLYGHENDGHMEALRVAAGLIPVRAGEVRLNGVNITHDKPEARGTRLIFWNQTHAASQLVKDAIFADRAWPREANQWLAWLGLDSKQDELVGTLAAEDRFLVHVANLISQTPGALLFEESLLLFERQVAFRLIRRLKRFVTKAKTVVVYASSDIETMRVFADTYYVFDQGKIAGS